MQPHQERVVVEEKELSEKIDKLRSFIGGEIFKNIDPNDKELLKIQFQFMSEYCAILRQRIARF